MLPPRGPSPDNPTHSPAPAPPTPPAHAEAPAQAPHPHSPPLRLTSPSASHSPGPSARTLFEILVREHADMLTAFLRSLLHRTDAVDDLFQETMLIAWRRLDDFDQSRPFGPWLRGIASNLVLERRRKFATRHTLTCEPDVLEALEHHFSTAHTLRGDSFRERADRLLACLERLPDKFRQTVELAYTKGLLLKQIAESLGEGEEAVKKRLQRARRALADCYLAPAPANTTPHEPNL